MKPENSQASQKESRQSPATLPAGKKPHLPAPVSRKRGDVA